MTAPRRPLRPVSRWWVIVGIAAVILAIWASTWWLLDQTSTLTGTAKATARMDAIKTGLSVGAGTGGAVALLLAMRRQWLNERDQLHREQVADVTQSHAERVASASEHDAAERRVTELYTKAADQLGSDKAPVRLAGLYALERLAQDNPVQRQTIVNVICAYLRMPFAAKRPTPRPAEELGALPPEAKAAAMDEDTARAAQWDQERMVRLTAQRILTFHLYTDKSPTEWPRTSTPEGPDFWPGIDIDLTEATLLGFSAAGIMVETARFIRTCFVDGANFAHANFEQQAHFHRARFEGGSAHFLGAWFGLRAVFVGVDFGEKKADFEGATFAGMVFFEDSVFGDATFGGGVTLDQARALADFNTNWGSERQWPAGWAERSLASDEQMPVPYGRWGNPAEPSPPGDPTWRLVVRDNQGEAEPS